MHIHSSTVIHVNSALHYVAVKTTNIYLYDLIHVSVSAYKPGHEVHDQLGSESHTCISFLHVCDHKTACTSVLLQMVSWNIGEY